MRKIRWECEKEKGSHIAHHRASGQHILNWNDPIAPSSTTEDGRGDEENYLLGWLIVAAA
jgi:hypothetical protein